MFCRIADCTSNCRWDLPGFSKEIQTWKNVSSRLIGCGIKINPDSLLKKNKKQKQNQNQTKTTTKQIKNPNQKQPQTPTPKNKKNKKKKPTTTKKGKTKHLKQNQPTKTLKAKPLHVFACSAGPVENRSWTGKLRDPFSCQSTFQL